MVSLSVFCEYLSSTVAGDKPDEEQVAVLDNIVARFPWFVTGRLMRERASGEQDPFLALHRTAYPPALSLADISAEELGILEETPEELIDKFLRMGEHRIVPDDLVSDDDVAAASGGIDLTDDLVSEELAEIYLAQGMNREAKAIYKKLSLLNPEKSVYFAEIIERIPGRKG